MRLAPCSSWDKGERKYARVTHTQDVSLFPALGPELVELLRVPDGLEEQGGDVDGVRGGARAVGDEYTELGVDVLVERYVALESSAEKVRWVTTMPERRQEGAPYDQECRDSRRPSIYNGPNAISSTATFIQLPQKLLTQGRTYYSLSLQDTGPQANAPYQTAPGQSHDYSSNRTALWSASTGSSSPSTLHCVRQCIGICGSWGRL